MCGTDPRCRLEGQACSMNYACWLNTLDKYRWLALPVLTADLARQPDAGDLLDRLPRQVSIAALRLGGRASRLAGVRSITLLPPFPTASSVMAS